MTDTLRRKHPTAVVPTHLVADLRVSHLAFRLWCHLDGLAGGDEVPMPTRKALGDAFECSTDTVDRATASLVDAGWLDKTAVAGGANAYALLIVTVEGGRRSAAPGAADLRRGRTVAAPPTSPVRALKDSHVRPVAGRVTGGAPTTYDPAFEEAWKAYPRKEAKAAAYRVWKATVKREGANVKPYLVTAAVNYAAECRADRRGPTYLKLGSTFYGRDEHWRDHLVAGRDRTARPQVTTGHPDFIPESLR